MSYPCSECGERAVEISLNEYYCTLCGETWDFIAPENRDYVGPDEYERKTEYYDMAEQRNRHRTISNSRRQRL